MVGMLEHQGLGRLRLCVLLRQGHQQHRAMGLQAVVPGGCVLVAHVLQRPLCVHGFEQVLQQLRQGGLERLRVSLHPSGGAVQAIKQGFPGQVLARWQLVQQVAPQKQVQAKGQEQGQGHRCEDPHREHRHEQHVQRRGHRAGHRQPGELLKHRARSGQEGIGQHQRCHEHLPRQQAVVRQGQVQIAALGSQRQGHADQGNGGRGCGHKAHQHPAQRVGVHGLRVPHHGDDATQEAQHAQLRPPPRPPLLQHSPPEQAAAQPARHQGGGPGGRAAQGAGVVQHGPRQGAQAQQFGAQAHGGIQVQPQQGRMQAQHVSGGCPAQPQ